VANLAIDLQRPIGGSGIGCTTFCRITCSAIQHTVAIMGWLSDRKTIHTVYTCVAFNTRNRLHLQYQVNRGIEASGTPPHSSCLPWLAQPALAHIVLTVMAINSILLRLRSTTNVLRLGVRWSVETAALFLTRRMGRFIKALLAMDLWSARLAKA
jgi:hypothetical protein